MKDLGYYKTDKILSKNCDYNIIYGGRGNGKSYAVKSFLIKDFYENGRQFAYIRRWDRDITKNLVTAYMADTPVSTLTGDKFDIVTADRGIISLGKLNGEKITNKSPAGFYFSVNQASRYASTAYPKLRNLLFEEFIPIDGRYAPDELELWTHLISTLTRNYSDIKIFMVCNSISRQSPYWDEYGVQDLVMRQDLGDLNVVERKTKGGVQKIAIEYTKPLKVTSKLFAGKRETMTVEGKWLADPQPKLPAGKWQNVAEFYVERLNMIYKCTYKIQGENYCIYVERAGKIPKNKRVISDKFSTSPYYTRRFDPINDYERQLFNMLPDKCCYSDDLTGTEFNETIEYFLTDT